MRVLILSVTAGQGHNSCAKAILHELQQRGLECQMVDAVSYINEWIGKRLDKSYLDMSKYTPDFWSFLYRTGVKISEHSYNRNGDVDLLPFVPKRFHQLVEEFVPDVVICTHVFASMMIGHLRKMNKIKAAIVGINTDFTLHPFWELVNQDYMVLAGRGMDYSVQKRGIRAEQLLPIGLPVDPKFDLSIEAVEAKRQLGLEDKLMVLLMSGSMGFGDMTSSVKALDLLPSDFQIVVICGNNEKLRAELEKNVEKGIFEKKVRVCGFANNVQEYMSAADIVCTKPGGLSVSETMNMRRPLVLTAPIPGLEEINAAFLVNNGVAVQSSSQYPLDETVYNLLRNPQQRERLVNAQIAMTPGKATSRLADFVIDKIRYQLGEDKKEEEESGKSFSVKQTELR
jgi:UDP-N-acetylglucosamine:LPS N-acetylglucosamine transferase